MSTSFRPWIAVASLPLLAVVACAATPAPTTPEPAAPTAAATAAPAPPPEVATAEPAASAAPDAGAAPAPKPSSGRPPVLKSDSTEVTDTFGSSPGAKLEVGDKELAILRIPENALLKATNVTFKIDSRGKSLGLAVGKIYRLTPIIPPSNEPAVIESNGPPFELALPAGNKKDANLAIGQLVTDEKGRDKLVWRIVAPKRIDDTTGTAHFELTGIADEYLHITTKAPAEPKK